MKARLHSRWLVFSTLAAGLLCQTGPCGLSIQDPEQAQVLARQVAQVVERTAVTVFSDTLFFILDSVLVRLGT